MNKKLIIWLVIIIVLVVAGVIFWMYQNSQPGKLDDFAKCLKDNGVKFYGAFWCPHCQQQKTLFANSAKYLPYIECSTPDSNGQLEVCKKENIQAYPTWQFSDDSRQEGELSLKELSEKSGCVLP